MARSRLLLPLIIAAAVAFLVVMASSGRTSGSAGPPRGAIILAVLTGAAILLVLSIRGGTRRRASFMEAAERLGLEADEDRPPEDLLAVVPEVREGSKFRHVLKGRLGDRDLQIFQSMYLVQTGQGSIPVSHTVYAVHVGRWPKVKITPNGLWQRLGLARREGMQLEDAHFNRLFAVATTDEDFAILLLSPEMQSFLASKPGLRWYIANGWLCLVYTGALNPTRMEASIERLERFLALAATEMDYL